MNIRSFEDLNQRIQRIKEDRDKKDASSRISKSNSSEKISKHDRQMELNQTDSSDNNMPDIPIEFRLGKIKVSYSPSTIDWENIVASDQEKFAALFPTISASGSYQRTLKKQKMYMQTQLIKKLHTQQQKKRRAKLLS